MLLKLACLRRSFAYGRSVRIDLEHRPEHVQRVATCHMTNPGWASLGRMLSVGRGDVVWVDLHGAFGVEKRGTRPCLVVSNARINERTPFVIVVPITDQAGQRPIREHVAVPAAEMGIGGKDSVIEAEQLRQIDRGRIDATRGVVAHLGAARLAEVDAALRSAMGV